MLKKIINCPLDCKLIFLWWVINVNSRNRKVRNNLQSVAYLYTIKIGSQTTWTDGGVSRFDIIKSIRTLFTGFGVFYPNKVETQWKGIRIDVIVKETIKGIMEGRGKVLEVAIDDENKKTED